MAAATASAGLLIADNAADAIEEIAGIAPEDVPEPEEGEPYTLLLLGSDRRPNLPDERSDTTMLVRLDPDHAVVSMLSLPRDLLVSIPGHGFDKLNSAYTSGGPRLTLRTVKLLTGLRIHEVIDVDFAGFAEAVNAIDCVYVDVDREYFAPPGAGFAEIDINAGYQRLCGLKALQYVRFRHTDNDVVRAARQQAFLREARQRVDVSGLVAGKGKKLLDAFTSNTRSTISGGGALLDIGRTLFEVRGAAVEQIQVKGDLGEDDIRAGTREVDKAVRRFLRTDEGLEGEPDAKHDEIEGNRAGGRDRADEREVRRAARDLEPADPQFGRYAATASRRLRIPAYYPTLAAAGTAFSRDSRTYDYETGENDRAEAYKLVMTRSHPEIVTEYYGVTGTSWEDPPILRRPSEIRDVDGRELLLFYSGDRLRLVGFREDGNAYWVANSLSLSLSESEMLGIAGTMAPA